MPEEEVNEATVTLTPREKEVYLELATSNSFMKQIALKLSIKENTLRKYVERIYAKMDLSDREELAHGWRKLMGYNRRKDD